MRLPARVVVGLLLLVMISPSVASARGRFRRTCSTCGNKAASAPAADNELTAAEKAAGWQLLFNGTDYTGWKTNTGKPIASKVEDGSMVPHKSGGEMLMYEKPLENFILQCDVKFTDEPKANSGVFFRVSDPKDPIYKGFEIQCGYAGTDWNSFGAIYSLAKPTKNVAKPNTEWNHVELKCDGPMVSVKLNGQLIAQMDADKFDKAGLRPDGSEHKFKKMVVKDMPRKGYIGFQDHSTPVYFKNVKLLELK